jgi:phosphomannomutase
MSTALEIQRSRTVALPIETRTSVLDRVRRTLLQEAERVDAADGIEAFYSDGVLRFEANGSEPVCEIRVQSSSPERAEALLDRATTLVSDLVRALGTGDSAGDMWCAPE